MKKLLIILMTLLFSFTACEKAEEENQKETPPNKITVERITVTEFPEYKYDNVHWDDDEAGDERYPDFTFRIKSDDEEFYSLEDVIFNVQSQSVVIYDDNTTYDDGKIIFNDVQKKYVFVLYDYDIDMDVMTNIEIIPWKEGEGYPDYKEYTNANFKLEFKYKYDR